MAAGNMLSNTGAVSCGEFGSSSILNMGVGASEVFKSKSGRFCIADDAGYIDAATASGVNIMGWVIGNSDVTAVATDGSTKLDVETDFLSKLWVMPACKDSAAAVTEAQLLAAIGLTFDIQKVSTYYQYADLGASAIDILLGYGYIYEGSAAGQQYMIVKVNPVKLAYTSHTDV